MLFSINQLILIFILIFVIGASGIFLNRKNILIVLLSIEILLLAINLIFITFAKYLDDAIGIIFSLFVLIIAAAESAIGLAILVNYYRYRGSILIEFINVMKS